MPNIASALKAEIARVARKEVKAEIEPLRKAAASYRGAIASLKRQVQSLEKELRPSRGNATARASPKVDTEEVDAGGTRRRFSAARLAAHRQKLGISAAAYGQLVGVTGQSIYKWELGKARPRASQLEALAAVRALGRREVAEQLGGVQSEE